jgi:hypothetical protein
VTDTPVWVCGAGGDEGGAGSADEDELVNVQLAEQARLERDLETKKRGAVAYRAFDDDDAAGPDGCMCATRAGAGGVRRSVRACIY